MVASSSKKHSKQNVLALAARAFLKDTKGETLECAPPVLLDLLDLCPAGSIDNMAHSTPHIAEYRALLNETNAPFAPATARNYMRFCTFIARNEVDEAVNAKALTFDKEIKPSDNATTSSLQQKLADRKAVIALIDELRLFSNLENVGQTLDGLVTTLMAAEKAGKRELVSYGMNRIVLGIFSGVMYRSISHSIALCALLCCLPTVDTVMDEICALLERIVSGNASEEFEGMKPSAVFSSACFLISTLIAYGEVGNALNINTTRTCVRTLCAAFQKSPVARIWATELLCRLLSKQKRKHIEAFGVPLRDAYFSSAITSGDWTPESVRLAIFLRSIMGNNVSGELTAVCKAEFITPSMLKDVGKAIFSSGSTWAPHPTVHPVFAAIFEALGVACDADPETATAKLRQFVRDFVKEVPSESAPQRAATRFIAAKTCQAIATRVFGPDGNRLLFEVVQSLDLGGLPALQTIPVAALEATPKRLAALVVSLCEQFHNAADALYGSDDANVDMDVDSDEDEEGEEPEAPVSQFTNAVRTFCLRQLGSILRVRVPEAAVADFDAVYTHIAKFMFLNGVVRPPTGCAPDPKSGVGARVSTEHRLICLSNLAQILGSGGRTGDSHAQAHSGRLHGALAQPAATFIRNCMVVVAQGTAEPAFSDAFGHDEEMKSKILTVLEKATGIQRRFVALIFLYSLVEDNVDEDGEIMQALTAALEAAMSNKNVTSVAMEVYKAAVFASPHAQRLYHDVCDVAEEIFRLGVAEGIDQQTVASLCPAVSEDDESVPIDIQLRTMKLLAFALQKVPTAAVLYETITPWLRYAAEQCLDRSVAANVTQMIKSNFRHFAALKADLSKVTGDAQKVLLELTALCQSIMRRRSTEPQRLAWLKEAVLQIVGTMNQAVLPEPVAAAVGGFYVELVTSPKLAIPVRHYLPSLKNHMSGTVVNVLPRLLMRLKATENPAAATKQVQSSISDILSVFVGLWSNKASTDVAQAVHEAVAVWKPATILSKGLDDNGAKSAASFLDGFLPTLNVVARIGNTSHAIAGEYVKVILANSVQLTQKSKSLIQAIAAAIRMPIPAKDWNLVPLLTRKSLETEAHQQHKKKVVEKRRREDDALLEKYIANGEKGKEDDDGANGADEAPKKRKKKERTVAQPLTAEDKKKKQLQRQAIVEKKREKRKISSDRRKAEKLSSKKKKTSKPRRRTKK
eukprot:PhM_4_TR17172/c0_g1_i1/m.22897